MELEPGVYVDGFLSFKEVRKRYESLKSDQTQAIEQLLRRAKDGEVVSREEVEQTLEDALVREDRLRAPLIST